MSEAATLFPTRFTAREAAKILGVSEDTLAVWRCAKRYPLAYVKMGRKVFYRAEDLKTFIDKRTVIVGEY
jgi:hypothetical protein